MISGIVFERIPNIGLNGIPKYHSQEQIDQIKYQIIQNNSNYLLHFWRPNQNFNSKTMLKLIDFCNDWMIIKNLVL